MKKLQFSLIAGFFLIVFFIVVALFATYKVPYEPKQKLLILMIGGFRHDYFSRDASSLIGFSRLRLEGASAHYLMPVFPSDSYPNWYTAATGLYPEKHGIVNRKFYDRETGQLHVDNLEPIWTQAVARGINTTVLYWDGCQLPFNVTSDREVSSSLSSSKIKSSAVNGKSGALTCEPVRHDWNSSHILREFTRTLYSVLDDFAKDRTTLALVYYPQVDYVGHKYGPDSLETVNAVRDIDLIIYNLLNQIERRSLTKSTNLYVLSDHGMSAPSRAIKLEHYVNLAEVKVSIGDRFAKGKGTFGMIQPHNSSRVEFIYNSLFGQDIEGLNVYLKENIPFGFHVKYLHKLWPIVIRADPDYYIDATDHATSEAVSDNAIDAIGFHGYFPQEFEDMRGMTHALGPVFRRGYKGGHIEQVDHYQLWCHVLKMRAKPNNGSWARVRDFIETYWPLINTQLLRWIEYLHEPTALAASLAHLAESHLYSYR